MRLLDEAQLKQWRAEFTERAMQFVGMAQWCDTMLECVNEGASANTMGTVRKQVYDAQVYAHAQAMTFHAANMVKPVEEEAQLRLL
jgi:hypothetical protein